MRTGCNLVVYVLALLCLVQLGTGCTERRKEDGAIKLKIKAFYSDYWAKNDSRGDSTWIPAGDTQLHIQECIPNSLLAGDSIVLDLRNRHYTSRLFGFFALPWIAIRERDSGLIQTQRTDTSVSAPIRRAWANPHVSTIDYAYASPGVVTGYPIPQYYAEPDVEGYAFCRPIGRIASK